MNGKEKNPEISLIVPIYNSAEFLQPVLDDIAGQSFGDFECILVNDGSTDKSLDICNAMAEKDSRFIVLSGPNIGLSGARNKGLKFVRGRMVGFIDSDDRINKTYLKALKEGIDKGADVAFCRYKNVFIHSPQNEVKKYRIIVTDGSYKNYFSNPHIGLIEGNYCWAKLYKREVIDGISFIEGKKCGNEDWCYSFEVAGRTKKIAYISAPLYYYLIRKDSLSNDRRKLKNNIPLSIITLVSTCNKIDPHSQEFREIVPYAFQNIASYHLQALIKGLENEEEFINSMVPLIPEMDRFHHVWKENKSNLRLMHRYFYGFMYRVLSLKERRIAKERGLLPTKTD